MLIKSIVLSLVFGSILNAKEIKVFFADNFKDENSYLQPFNNWYAGSSDAKYSLKELYKDGWSISNVVKTNASAREWQMTFFMEI